MPCEHGDLDLASIASYKVTSRTYVLKVASQYRRSIQFLFHLNSLGFVTTGTVARRDSCWGWTGCHRQRILAGDTADGREGGTSTLDGAVVRKHGTLQHLPALFACGGGTWSSYARSHPLLLSENKISVPFVDAEQRDRPSGMSRSAPSNRSGPAPSCAFKSSPLKSRL